MSSHPEEKNVLLNSQNEQSKTEITDRTDRTDYSEISNDDFINGMFGELKLERPITVSFKGNPATVKNSAWFGQAYAKGKTLLPSNANNYISFAIYTSDSEGQYRRKKALFAALYAIMLDDVGVKVAAERVTLAPSWIIETSAGNYQYGYILAEPLCNANDATNLLDSIIAAGLCDPGANGACARIGRLPVAVNGKYDFKCRLVEWKPELRYSVQQIIDGLQVELRENATRKVAPRSANDPTTHDDVHIPRADDNPVIAALSLRGLYKSPLGSGKHDITCPWVQEHTDQSDHGTAYWEPSETYPIGGFKCQHGHCADRRVSTLHGYLDITKDVAKHLPAIRVSAGEINRIVDIAEAELSKTMRHYQRGGIIVTVATDPATRATNIKTLSLPSLIRVLAGLAVWQRFDKREMDWVTCDPPEKHTKILHDAIHYPHLPILNGIARQPYFRADGGLVLSAGYDAKTGMFGVFDPRHFNVPENPTREQAGIALLKLDELLSEFAFKTPNDKAAALSAIITATVRPSLRLSVMYHVHAPQIASGKSYLCEVITLFATPEKSTPHSFPADDEEMRKLLLAELLTAPAVIEFDNLTTDLIPHKSLCTALTSENMSGRILGQSKTAEVGTRALFLSSGNNVEPVRDMTRRVVTIKLDPQCETPATREFNKNPVADVRSKRGEFISAALTIVRAWLVAGRPKTEIKALSSYAEWSELCRQPLLWLDLADPAAIVFETMAHDPDREELAAFLDVWEQRYGKYATAIKRVVADCALWADLKEVLPDLAIERDGTVNKRKLGWWLKRHSGRVVNGLRLVVDDGFKTNSVRWRIEKIETKSV
ncbi:MAG: hypothetical protein ACXWFG_13450 [Methylobacter sp.]